MDLAYWLFAAAPWVGGILGLAFSVVVLGGIALLIHQAGLYYVVPKWAIKGLSARLTTR